MPAGIGILSGEDRLKILIVTDAWAPQVNGVVRTLEMLGRDLRALGHEVRYATPEGRFNDDTCSDVADLAAAHFKAIKVARWVMMRSGLAEDESDWRRWSFEVTDDRQQSRLSVLFQSCLLQEDCSHPARATLHFHQPSSS